MSFSLYQAQLVISSTLHIRRPALTQENVLTGSQAKKT